jgi:phage shock protein PspC (stress-responsive transcriptional regulator)
MSEHDQQADGPERADGPEHVDGPERVTPPPRRILRSREDRVLAGVCGGLGRYFGVDPTLFRVAAVVLVLLGGAGVLLYLAAVLLIPGEPAAGQPVPAGPVEGRGRTLAIVGVIVLLLIGWPILLGGSLLAAGVLVPLAVLVLVGVLVWWVASGEGPSGEARDIARRAALGIAVLILCLAVAAAAGWVAGVGGAGAVAALVIVAGIAILAGAFVRPVRWLILPAVLVAVSAGTVAAAGIDLKGGVGSREYRPGSTADLRERYRLGMGELLVDLRQTDLPMGDTPLHLKVGVGEARLVVPDGVCVATRAHVGLGAVDAFDRQNAGADVDVRDEPQAPAGISRLVVDADVGVGHLDVRHNYGGFDDPGFRGDVFGERGTNAACLGANG